MASADEKVKALMTWCGDTKLKFKVNGKRAGTASYDRYAKYSQGKTLREALENGLDVPDLINDFKVGLIEDLGGPYRKEEIDVCLDPKSFTDIAEQKLWAVAKRFHGGRAVAMCDKLGLDKSEVTKQVGWCETSVMRAQRLVADKAAEQILTEVGENGKVTDDHVMGIMKLWSFRRNDTRRAVTPPGSKHIYSDTIGAFQNQAGQWSAAFVTTNYHNFVKLIVRWHKDSLGGEDFPWTTLHINSSVQAPRHRDHNSCGPVLIKALGDFTGGLLRHWGTADNLTADVDRLTESGSQLYDVRKAVTLDGNRCHEVQEFNGTRFSFNFFIHRRYWTIKEDVVGELNAVNIKIPASATVERQLKALGVSMMSAPKPQPQKPGGNGAAQSQPALAANKLSFAQKCKMAKQQEDTGKSKKRQQEEVKDSTGKGNITPEKKVKEPRVTPQKGARDEQPTQAGAASGDEDQPEEVSESVQANRKEACALAAELVQQSKKRRQKLTDDDLIKVLKLWKFGQNTSRTNVIPDGKQYVHSDTFGVVSMLTGEAMASHCVRSAPEVMMLLSQWLKDNQAKHFPSMKKDFPFTSINVNYAYAAKLHRDRNNAGPSLIIALGDFAGGELNYFPDDDGKMKLDQLPTELSKPLDIKGKLTLFDGNRGHSVEDFTGDRYSLVFFSSGCYVRTKDEVKNFLTKQGGANWPTQDSITYAQEFLPTPRGYHVEGGVAFTGGSGPLDSMLSGGQAKRSEAVIRPQRSAAQVTAAPAEHKSEKAEAGTKRKQPEPSSKEANNSASKEDDEEDVKDGEQEDEVPEVSVESWREMVVAGLEDAQPSSNLASVLFEPSQPGEREGFALFAMMHETMEALLPEDQKISSGVVLTNVFRQGIYNSRRNPEAAEVELVSALNLLLPADPVKNGVLTSAAEGAFNLNLKHGDDVAAAALEGRKKQQTLKLLGGKSLSMEQVQKVRTQALKAAEDANGEYKKTLMSLLASSQSQGRETLWLVRCLQGKASVGRLSALRALAHAFMLSFREASAGIGEPVAEGGEPTPVSSPPLALDRLVVYMEALAQTCILAHGQAGGTQPLVKALFAGMQQATGFGGFVEFVDRACPLALKVPILPMRAPWTYSKKRALTRIENACGARSLAAEWLYEGERVQIHVGKEGVKLFQDLEEKTPTDLLGENLPKDLLAAVGGKEVILDAVIQGSPSKKEEDDKTVQKDIMDRLASGIASEEMDSEIEALEAKLKALKRARRTGSGNEPKLVVFDLLWQDGQSLVGCALRMRRDLLRRVLVEKEPTLSIAKVHDFAEGIPEVSTMTAMIKEGTNTGRAGGLVLKGLECPYEAGRRPGFWQQSVEYKAKKPAVQG